MKENLLNRVAREAGVGFLSDLHSAKHVEKIYRVVCGFPIQEYTLSEWQEAAAYILGQTPRSFESAADAASYLKRGLEAVMHIG